MSTSSPRLLLALVAASGLLTLPSGASGQEGASIVGSVLRADGSPAATAEVVVVDTNLRTVTGADGSFRLDGVPQGLQSIATTYLGREAGETTVQVPARGTVRAEIRLAPSFAIDGIVVSASRNAKILRDVPASVSVVTPAELARRAPTVQGEELAGLSNVAIRDNSEGTFTSIRIRGVPNSHQNNVVLALVDGVPFVTGGDEVDIERLVPPSLVERVEVVKGPTSALYGRGAVSGTINYVTQPAFGRRGVEVGTQLGSFGHVRPWANLHIPITEGRHQLMISALYEEKDGVVDGAPRESWNLFLKDELLIGARTRLTLMGNVLDVEQAASNHLPFTESLDPLVEIDARENFQIPGAGDDRFVAFASGRLEHRLRPGLTLSAVGHVRRHETDTRLGFSDSFSTDQNAFFWNGFASLEEDDTWFFEPQIEWDAGRVRMTAGASWEAKSGREANPWTGENGFPTPDFEFLFYVQKVDAASGQVLNADRFVTDTLNTYEYDGSVGALYAQFEVDLTDRLLLTLGGRYDDFSRDLAVRRPVDGTPAETIRGNESHFSPKVSLAADLSDEVTLYGAFGEGFNPAFGPPFVFSGRPDDLEPEVARNYEVGLKGTAAGGALGFSLAAFRLDRNDLLLTLFAGGGGTQSVNAGEQRSSGFEADLFARLGGGVTATLAYGYVNSEWIDNRFANAFSGELIDWSGNDVAGVPEHTGSVSLARDWSTLSLSTWYDFRSDYFVDNDNTIEGGGFGLLHASAALRPSLLEGAELRLTAKNVLDEDYHYFFPGAFGGVEGFRGRPFELLAELRYAW